MWYCGHLHQYSREEMAVARDDVHSVTYRCHIQVHTPTDTDTNTYRCKTDYFNLRSCGWYRYNTIQTDTYTDIRIEMLCDAILWTSTPVLKRGKGSGQGWCSQCCTQVSHTGTYWYRNRYIQGQTNTEGRSRLISPHFPSDRHKKRLTT